MLNKEVYPEYFTEEDYGAELDKLLALDSLAHSFVFYFLASYCMFIRKEEFLSEEKYDKLCEYLLTKKDQLSDWKGIVQDLERRTCSLEWPDKIEDWDKDKHYPLYIENTIKKLEDNMDVDFFVGVWTESESVN
jgi:hypothetical protein